MMWSRGCVLHAPPHRPQVLALKTACSLCCCPLHGSGHQPGNLAYSPVAAGLVPIAMFLLQIVNLYMAINVGMARKVSRLSGLFLSPIARVGSALNRS